MTTKKMTRREVIWGTISAAGIASIGKAMYDSEAAIKKEEKAAVLLRNDKDYSTLSAKAKDLSKFLDEVNKAKSEIEAKTNRSLGISSDVDTEVRMNMLELLSSSAVTIIGIQALYNQLNKRKLKEGKDVLGDTETQLSK